MIQSQLQYKITKQSLKKFQEALKLAEDLPETEDILLKKLHIDSIESMIDTFEQEIRHYESKLTLWKESIFEGDFLKEIKFRLISFDGKCGKAAYLRDGGMTELHWNNEGHSVNYFGEELPPNVSLGIMKDGGTRYAFNGYVFSQQDVRDLLSKTW